MFLLKRLKLKIAHFFLLFLRHYLTENSDLLENYRHLFTFNDFL